MRFLFLSFFILFQFLPEAKLLTQTEGFASWNQSLDFDLKPAFQIYPPDSKILLAESANKTFDPFIDYGEFQDNIAEEESLSFFQHGRSLSIILVSGYEGVTFNMRQIYGDSLFFVGLNVSFFIDFHIAFQLSGMFPTGHYNSLYNTTASFFHYGLDIKYYLHKQYLNEEQKFFNPYLIAGPFIFNSKLIAPKNLPSQNQISNQIPIVPPASTQAETPAIPPISNTTQDERVLFEEIKPELGLKTGLGLELNLIDPLFITFEITHLYTNFTRFENKDLSQTNLPPLAQAPQNQDIFYRLQYPSRPEIQGYKFYGDLFQITFQAGINF